MPGRKPTQEPFDFAAWFGDPPPPRAPWQTDAQYAVSVEEHHHRNDSMGVWLALFQVLATKLGCARHCSRRGCRRARRCSARRSRSGDGCFIGAMVPPCIPPDTKLIEALREAVKSKLNRCRAGVDEPFPHYAPEDLAAIGPLPPGWPGRDFPVRNECPGAEHILK